MSWVLFFCFQEEKLRLIQNAGIPTCETIKFALREKEMVINMDGQMKNAHFEPLGKNCRVLVTAEHRFTTDTLLLADFSMPRPGEACADLGTGCGTIPLLWRMRGRPKSILAVELQREAAELAERSVAENGFSREIEVICGDVRNYKEFLSHQSLQLMACNPPYYPLGSGYAGEGPRRAARHEETLTLEDLSGAARYGLSWGGRLCICLPVERLAEAMELFRKSGLEPKRLRLVQSGPEKPPYLFLLECRRGGKPGLAVEATLLLTDGAGKPTPELEKIYGSYTETAGKDR